MATAAVWTWWMKSMTGTSFQHASAAERSAVQVPTGVLTYVTTRSWSAVRSPVISASSSTVLLLRVCALVLVTFHCPWTSSSSKSKTVSRMP